MCDRDPLERWGMGRVTLLGDAAHPMYPVGSNGAAQAILDGRVLARALVEHGDVVQALRSYEAERLAATSPIVLSNRQMGPEQVIDLVAARAPQGFDAAGRRDLTGGAGGDRRPLPQGRRLRARASEPRQISEPDPRHTMASVVRALRPRWRPGDLSTSAATVFFRNARAW